MVPISFPFTLLLLTWSATGDNSSSTSSSPPVPRTKKDPGLFLKHRAKLFLELQKEIQLKKVFFHFFEDGLSNCSMVPRARAIPVIRLYLRYATG